MKKIFALLLAACLGIALFGCNRGAKPEEAALVISGLAEGGIVLTGERLRQDYEPAEREAVSRNSKGDEKQIRAKGVLLEEILRRQSISQKDFDSAVASAADGYSIMIPNSILREREILLAYEYNGEPLEKPRMVIPEERAMYWVKNLMGIEFTSAQTVLVARKISLAGLIDKLQGQAVAYEHGGAACKALPIALLLQETGAKKTEFVEIKAADGLEKTERYSVFSKQLLVFEGTPDAPLFAGPDLPEGMQVKNVTSIQIGDILIKA